MGAADQTPAITSRRLYAAGSILAAAFMCLRIVLTFYVFTQTYDEPYHIAHGMQWLSNGEYRYEGEHTPLARIAAAVPLYLAGQRQRGADTNTALGNAILGEGSRYKRNLALARSGELPFVVLALAGIWIWARRTFGPRAAFFSVLLFSLLPPVLAHGGLATTDMAVTAACVWAFYAFSRFLEERTLKTGLALGFWFGFAVICKLSAIPFLGAGFIFLLTPWFIHTRQTLQKARVIRHLAAATLVSALVIWACYRFAVTPVFTENEIEQSSSNVAALLEKPGLIRTIATTPIPAGRFIHAIVQVTRHDQKGHKAYLLGEQSADGWWYFFPVVLAIKTPLGFLILALCGLAVQFIRLRHGEWKTAAPAIFAIAILLVVLPSRINIGVRHILPIYPLLAIAAGYFVDISLRRARLFQTIFVFACMAWLCTNSLLAHPDYLAWFNEIADAHPERFSIDSDLDWGQDLGRLTQRLQELHAPSVAPYIFTSADLRQFALPPATQIRCDTRPTGYVALSVNAVYLDGPFRNFLLSCPSRNDEFTLTMPFEQIGKSIMLYRYP